MSYLSYVSQLVLVVVRSNACSLQGSGKKGKGNGDRTKLTPEEIMNVIEERREKKKGGKRKRSPSPTAASAADSKKKAKKRWKLETYCFNLWLLL